jgi:hypothetical protein
VNEIILTSNTHNELSEVQKVSGAGKVLCVGSVQLDCGFKGLHIPVYLFTFLLMLQTMEFYNLFYLAVFRAVFVNVSVSSVLRYT